MTKLVCDLHEIVYESSPRLCEILLSAFILNVRYCSSQGRSVSILLQMEMF